MKLILAFTLLLASLSAQPAPDPRALDNQAATYAMAGRHDLAARALVELYKLKPSEEVRLRLARNQSWAGWTTAAIQTYSLYLKARPADRSATMELIRLKRWHGDYSGAEKLCNQLLGHDAGDAQVLALKAEVLHWAGNRTRSARASADAAAQIDPELPDARVARIYALRDQGERSAASREFQVLADQVARRGALTPAATYGDSYRLLETEFARSGHTQQPAYSTYNDSDGIHNSYAGFQVVAPVADHKLRLGLGQWRTSAPLGRQFTSGRDHSFVSEFTAGSVFQAAPSVWVTALGGASRRSSSSAVRPLFDFQVSAAPLDRWTFDFTAGREFLKVTPKAVDLDISSYRLGGGAEYAFDARTSLSGHVGRHFWSDHNRSLEGDATFRRILHYYKPFMIDAGAQTHWERFDYDTGFASGFFTPERYRRHESFLGIHGELGRRLKYEVRGAAGAQQLARGGDHRLSWELSPSVSLRLAGPLELFAGYQRRNYSLISRHGWYQGFFITLGIRP